MRQKGEGSCCRCVKEQITIVAIFPGGAGDKEPTCQCWDPQVGEMPWRRAWKRAAVLLPGESSWTKELGGLQSMGSQRVD